MTSAISILADAALAAASGGGRTTYRFARLAPFAQDAWFYVALAAAVLVVAGYVVWMYRRDAVELKPGVGPLLAVLRLAALGAALVYFLDLEKRTEREVIENSRVLILVDTSQSMGEPAAGAGGAESSSRRIDEVIAAFDSGVLLDELRRVHDAVVVRFDRETERVVSLEKFVPGNQETNVSRSPVESDVSRSPFDWSAALLPQGPETRLASAVKHLLVEERGEPVSAVIVISDGAQNAGAPIADITDLARQAEIPVYTIGLGSNRRPSNVAIADLVAPTRAYPNDAFTVTGYIQARNFPGSRVTAELYSRDPTQPDDEGVLEQRERVLLGADGEIVPVAFTVQAAGGTRRTFELRLADAGEDHNPADNRQEADVQIVEEKTRVLLFAGGPSREYQFLRSLLHRDQEVVLDVLLQSAIPVISQDADQVLYAFPSTKEELYEYDAVIAIDPDWSNLHAAADEEDASGVYDRAALVDLVEAWVAEEAGGLIAVGGPIHTDQWTRLPELAKIRALYPVTFRRRFTLLSDAEYGSGKPLPLRFTPEGLDAEFLWITDDPSSRLAWAGFPGVYGYYDVRGAKPGATVHAYVDDPDSLVADDGIAYFAEQLYGAGRVFYLGSGEMWRLRALEEAYFERFYTKLIRHVSQGRLLRGSSHGLLLVERDRYQPGETIVVRAQLKDARHEPLETPTVTVHVTQPDGTTKAIVLKPDGERKGFCAGQWTVTSEGGYRLDLPVPETTDEILSRRIQVKGSNPEREHSVRNDALLSEIAAATGGVYYVGLDSALGRSGGKPLPAQLRDRSETTIVAGTPDRHFEQQLMQWLLGVICGALALEWLIRRLCKLA